MSIRIDRNALHRGWGYYDIMHLERRVARVYEDGHCTVYFPSFLPYNLYLETGGGMDSRLDNLNNFYYWCASRVLTLDRAYAKEILSAIGAGQATTDRDRAAVTVACHGLSLTDVFWLRGKGEKLTFSEISLYTHSLSDTFADVSLRGRAITAQNSELLTPEDAAGDIATAGVAPKAWVRRDGKFYLLKDGDRRDVKAELLVSKIADCFDIDHVSYEPAAFDGLPVSRCGLITSEGQSIVTYEAVNLYCVNHGKNTLDFVLKRDAEAYYKMNIFDYLIGNTDRHWGNWGFWADNRTNRLGKLHPLMDFNKAFQSYDTEEGALCQTTAARMTQKEAALEAVKRIGLPQLREVPGTWFEDVGMRDMFERRLRGLRETKKQG